MNEHVHVNVHVPECGTKGIREIAFDPETRRSFSLGLKVMACGWGDRRFTCTFTFTCTSTFTFGRD